LIYVNKRTIELVDTIIRRDRRAIILLQADEGPWPEAYVRDEIFALGADVTEVDWGKVDSLALREKMGILNAIYAPGLEGAVSTIPPLNTFRSLFTTLGLVDLPNRPATYRVYMNRSNLYQYRDVSEELLKASGATTP
jgi:hypothetical protein